MSIAVSSGSTSTTPNHHHESTRFLLGMAPPPPPPPSDREERERAGRIRTLLDLLTTEKMDGLDRATSTRPHSSHHHQSGPGNNNITRSWRTRLGLKVIGCCGSVTWPYGSPPLIEENENENDVVVVELQEARGGEGESRDQEESQSLAAALAAERQFRGGGGDDVATEGLMTPSRVSLMRLLEETGETEKEKEKEKELIIEGEVGNDSVCCVCMGRKKGAALIPCGHTYCRVCSREVWLNRGSCPLCNRPILDILDIF